MADQQGADTRHLCVSGRRIQRAPLAGGEVVLMGNTQLRYERLSSC